MYISSHMMGQYWALRRADLDAHMGSFGSQMGTSNRAKVHMGDLTLVKGYCCEN